MIIACIFVLFYYNNYSFCVFQIPVTLLHGTKNERDFLKKDILKLTTVSDVETYPVIVTSYNIILQDPYLSRINWRYLIVDEAHRLKNCECLLIKYATISLHLIRDPQFIALPSSKFCFYNFLFLFVS